MYETLARCVEVLEELPSTETAVLTKFTPALQDLATAAKEIFRRAVEVNSSEDEYDDEDIYWNPVLDKWLDKPSTDETPCLEIYRIMQRFRKSRRCMNSDCGKTPESSFQRFPRCSGCGLVSYCSKDCQRKAWKLKDFPDNPRSHRLVCKDLARLQTVFPRTDEPELELIPELKLHLYSDTALSIEEVVERIGKEELKVALKAADEFPRRAWNYRSPESSQESRDKQLEELLMEVAVALDPKYTLETIKEITRRVQAFEELVEFYLGRFGLHG